MNQRLLSGEQEYIQDPRDEEIVRLRQIKGQLDEALRLERIRSQSLESGARELKHVLTPLYRALQKVFGEFNEMGMSETSTPAPARQESESKMAQAWSKWIDKLGGHRGSFIQALLDHGPSTANQLKVAMGINRMPTVYTVAHQLSKLGLITKNGEQYALKE